MALTLLALYWVAVTPAIVTVWVMVFDGGGGVGGVGAVGGAVGGEVGAVGGDGGGDGAVGAGDGAPLPDPVPERRTSVSPRPPNHLFPRPNHLAG